MNRGRLNAHGHEKNYEVHYDSDNIASSVTNDMRVKIMLVLEIVAARTTKILDDKGQLLNREFTENEEPIHMEIPQSSEK